MRSLFAAAFMAASLAASAPALAQAPSGHDGESSPFKTAARFIENCDARPGADGERPPENYACLSYMAGLIEGYGVGAFANGNRAPYCLPRPVTLVEMMDMMAVAIERGVPGETPTAVVLHNILAVTFPCAPDAEDTPGATDTPDAPDQDAGNGATAQ